MMEKKLFTTIDESAIFDCLVTSDEMLNQPITPTKSSQASVATIDDLMIKDSFDQWFVPAVGPFSNISNQGDSY